MLKIKDKSIYDKEVVKMIESYEKTTKEHPIKDEKSRELMNAVESCVETIDALVRAGIAFEDNKELCARIHLVMPVIGGMLSSECERYTKQTSSEVDKLIDEAVDKLTDDIIQLLNKIVEE